MTIPSKIVFCFGYRFCFAGGFAAAVRCFSVNRLVGFRPRQFAQLTLLGLTQTSLQYLFFYIGLCVHLRRENGQS